MLIKIYSKVDHPPSARQPANNKQILTMVSMRRRQKLWRQRSLLWSPLPLAVAAAKPQAVASAVSTATTAVATATATTAVSFASVLVDCCLCLCPLPLLHQCCHCRHHFQPSLSLLSQLPSPPSPPAFRCRFYLIIECVCAHCHRCDVVAIAAVSPPPPLPLLSLSLSLSPLPLSPPPVAVAAAIIVDWFIRGWCSTCTHPSAFWQIIAIIWQGFSVRRSMCKCEFCICSTNTVPDGSLNVLTYNIYGHTNRTWSFCNVWWCLCLNKSPFFATNTQKTVKHRLEKENKLNTVSYMLIMLGQRHHILRAEHKK